MATSYVGAEFRPKGVPDYDEPDWATRKRVEAVFKWDRVLAEFQRARGKDRTLTRKNRMQWVRSHYPPPEMLDPSPRSTASDSAPSSTAAAPASQSEPPAAPLDDVAEPEPPEPEDTAPGPQVWNFSDGSLKDDVLNSIRWVWHNIPAYRRGRVKFKDAPSPGAWEMLETAVDDPKWFQLNVVNTVLKKLEELDEKVHERNDNGRPLGVLRRILAARQAG